MPHDFGSAKHVDKRMKMAGLGRLRWYCTPCEKQCRDDNGFKQHTLSEGHVRKMQNITDLRGTIDGLSQEFQTAFLNLLRTSHREKSVHANRFYQTYIADKNHIHLNSTKWSSLTELVKYLGREGLCVVEEKDDGLFIAWIDRSPEALRRAAELRKKEQAEAADQSREEDLIKAQVARARAQLPATRAAPPPPTPAPIEPGQAITFQMPAPIRITKESSTATKPKKAVPNVFKTAKQAKKRKLSELASSETPT